MSKRRIGSARSRPFAAAMLVLLVIGLAGCSGLASTAPVDEPIVLEPVQTQVLAQGAAMLGEETVTLKVASFNVLYGAGFDRRYDINIPERFKGRDRLPDLVAFLRQVDADVIAMQE